jgi:hypothetical protein
LGVISKAKDVKLRLPKLQMLNDVVAPVGAPGSGQEQDAIRHVHNVICPDLAPLTIDPASESTSSRGAAHSAKGFFFAF